jgi:hypothetical protein
MSGFVIGGLVVTGLLLIQLPIGILAGRFLRHCREAAEARAAARIFSGDRPHCPECEVLAGARDLAVLIPCAAHKPGRYAGRHDGSTW